MKALFIDASITELKKNYLSIARHLADEDSVFQAVFLNVETASYVVDELEEKSTQEIGKYDFIKLVGLGSFNRKRINVFLEEQKPDFLFIDSMNISNEVWIAICHEMGIKVFLYPHGFEVENLYYKSSQIIGKLRKVLRYCYAVLNISILLHLPYIKTLLQYINFIRKGSPLKGTFLDDPKLYPDTVFVYSDYYKGFWERKYGIRNVNYVQIMPFDFTLVGDILEKPEENALCYITQTLCEDGRFSQEEFERLLESYREVAKSVNKFIIKLHPRVNSRLYDRIFKGLPNVEIRRDFPHCKVYMTHYSSMVYTGVLSSGNVIIHELPGQPTANVFADVASTVVHSTRDIIAEYNRLSGQDIIPFEERCHRISYYAHYSGESPYDVIYKTIYNK